MRKYWTISFSNGKSNSSSGVKVYQKRMKRLISIKIVRIRFILWRISKRYTRRRCLNKGIFYYEGYSLTKKNTRSWKRRYNKNLINYKKFRKESIMVSSSKGRMLLKNWWGFSIRKNKIGFYAKISLISGRPTWKYFSIRIWSIWQIYT